MITFKIISDLTEAEKIWKLLSSNEEIFDVWEFRYSYYKYLNYPLFFLTAFENNEAIALLPLMENKGVLEFFGSNFMSYNTLFVKRGYEHLKKDLIYQLNKPANLKWMKEPVEIPSLETDDKSTYFLNLMEIKNIDEYFENLWGGGSKSRSKTRQQIRKIESLNPEIKYNNFSDLKSLIKLNIEKFGEESVFKKPFRIDFFNELINNFECHMISIFIENNFKGSILSLKHNNIFYALTIGAESSINNLGKYLYIKNIELAINLKSTKYDAMEGNYGWKEAFGFRPRPQYFLNLTNE